MLTEDFLDDVINKEKKSIWDPPDESKENGNGLICNSNPITFEDSIQKIQDP